MKFALFLLPLTLSAGTALAGGAPQHADHAHAQHAATAQPDAFSKFDLNKDGKLTKVELKTHPKLAHWSMADTNKDGALDRKEFAALEAM